MPCCHFAVSKSEPLTTPHYVSRGWVFSLGTEFPQTLIGGWACDKVYLSIVWDFTFVAVLEILLFVSIFWTIFPPDLPCISKDFLFLKIIMCVMS